MHAATTTTKCVASSDVARGGGEGVVRYVPGRRVEAEMGLEAR